ncbi:MAG: pyruvate formate lyase family protein, partial [Chloroflexota bacterium]
MPITQRVKTLRQQSLDAKETLSSERAELLTAFCQQQVELMSEPVRRAKAFAYILEHKHIEIYPGELIVGEKGDAPKTAPTFPELCCHSLQDLDILNSREKTSFHVEAATRRAYEQTVIPYWRGKSMRELILNEMSKEWKAAYEAGIFTEFMEQRSPGHTVLDDKIYRKGMLDFQAEIEVHLAALDFLHDPEAYDKQQELRGM